MRIREKEKQKQYRRTWYERHRHLVLANRKRQRRKMRDWYNAQKAKPCTDCGQTFPPYVMDYDHLDAAEKADLASRLVHQLSMKRLTAEIAKCELVCANCHRIRTHQRKECQKRAKNVCDLS